MMQAGLGKKPDPVSKIARAKRAGDMTQAVELLPSKFVAQKKERFDKHKQ
jgi:hypothetical protein